MADKRPSAETMAAVSGEAIIRAERAEAQLAEIQDALGCGGGYGRETLDRVRLAVASQARLEQAEDERDAVLTQVARLRKALTEAAYHLDACSGYGDPRVEIWAREARKATDAG